MRGAVAVGLVAMTIGGGVVIGGAGDPPAVGEAAPEFSLKGLDGAAVTLGELTKEGPVVLVMLRGYPGYQCPLCTRQVADLRSRARDFRAAGAKVVMVYPGPAAELGAKAAEFLGGTKLPEGYRLLVDPGYGFTESYGLRWDAENETAYPSTFVIDKGGRVRFAKVSRSHGDRVAAADVAKALAGLGGAGN